MNNNVIILIVATIIFYIVGGSVDYWQSARHHGKPIPYFLKNYFALFWLILYSGFLPFVLVAAASNFNTTLIIKYLGAFFIGMSLWDFTYSLLETKKPVFPVKDYWFWGKRDYGLTKNQIAVWHLLRLALGLYLISL